MIACLDVHYRRSKAASGCVAIESWESADIVNERAVKIEKVEPYQPGQFLLRELPCLLAVLHQLDNRPDIVVIDGYVSLTPAGSPGLGSKLYDAMNKSVPVIGAAKTRYATATHAELVYRSQSRSPLFVTSAGVAQGKAASAIQRMHGRFRIPMALRKVDRLCRVELRRTGA